MSTPLRQSTASQEILLGPFVDDTDGKTPETGLTISNTDIQLRKRGSTSFVNKNSGGATHMANGWYSAVLDATDTDTLGELEATVNEAGALVVIARFIVYPANIFDSLFLGTDLVDVSVTQLAGSAIDQSAGLINANVKQISGDAAAADTLELFIENYVRTSGTAQAGGASTITLAAGDTAANDRYIGNTILLIAGTGAGQVREGTDYVNATKVLTVSPAWETTPDNTTQYVIIGTAQAPTGSSAPTAAQNADAVWDELLSGHVISGSAGEALAAAGSGGDVPGALEDFFINNTVAEPTSPPSWPMSFFDMLAWFAASGRGINKKIQTVTQLRLRNQADSADIGQRDTTDSGSEFTEGPWS